MFEAQITRGGIQTSLGRFCTAEEAARAYDDAVRKAGRRVVNFPRPGTDEVQAVKGEREEVTLKRHAAKQGAGGASAAGGIVSHGMHAPSTKRRAAVPPPSQPPRKRAAASVKAQTPAPVKTEAPVAPPPAPFTRRPPHRIELGASLPPAVEEPGEFAPSKGIKTELPEAPPPAPYTRRPPHRIDTTSWPPPADEKAVAMDPGDEQHVALDAPARCIKEELPAAASKPE